MTGYLWRVAASVVASELVPARARAALLRRLGITAGEALVMHAGARLGSSRITFGDRVFVNTGLDYDGNAPVVVGDRVALGPGVRLVTVTHEIGGSERRCTSEPVCAPIVIGDGSWVAAGVTILPGVTVAPGCVVAAGAVVTASTTPDGLYAGVPARRVRDLPVAGPAEPRATTGAPAPGTPASPPLTRTNR